MPQILVPSNQCTTQTKEFFCFQYCKTIFYDIGIVFVFSWYYYCFCLSLQKWQNPFLLIENLYIFSIAKLYLIIHYHEKLLVILILILLKNIVFYCPLLWTSLNKKCTECFLSYMKILNTILKFIKKSLKYTFQKAHSEKRNII